MQKSSFTAIPYRARTGFSLCSKFSQGKTCFHYREPLFSLQGSCIHYRDFPVRITTQGDPCSHYREWVCSGSKPAGNNKLQNNKAAELDQKQSTVPPIHYFSLWQMFKTQYFGVYSNFLHTIEYNLMIRSNFIIDCIEWKEGALILALRSCNGLD